MRHRLIAVLRRAAFCTCLGAMVWGGLWLFGEDDSPLPPEWNPFRPLSINEPITPLTGMKLERAATDGALCRRVLAEEARFTALRDLTPDNACGIRNRVRLDRVGRAALAPVETQCAVALRLAMWERHGVQPVARQIMGTSVARIDHFSSYSCRPIRTERGDGSRLSSHAAAAAIDVAGFVLTDGRQVSLLRDWSGGAAEARFLRAARDAACHWFGTTLGPDFNSLHADHFHLQASGRGLCR